MNFKHSENSHVSGQKPTANRGHASLLISFFEPAFFALEKVVEFPDQLQESGVVFLLLDQCT